MSDMLGNRSDLRLVLLGAAVFFMLAFVVSAADQDDPIGEESRNNVDNSYMDTAEYIGYGACKACHYSQGSGFGNSPHSESLQPPTPDNVLADFSGSINVTEPANVTISFGFDAEKGKYSVMINNTTYQVKWRMGGPIWEKQYFLTQVGNSTYFLPTVWNDDGGPVEDWNITDLDNWVEGNGTPKAPAFNSSWDKNCSGCHTTGNTVTKNEIGEWVADYAQEGIQCEACHGPGSAHFGNRKFIWKSNEPNVCGQCHVYGLTKQGNFTWPAGLRLGDEVESVFDLTNDPEHVWDDGMAKSIHMEYNEFSISAHGSSSGALAKSPGCAQCKSTDAFLYKLNGKEIPEDMTNFTTVVSCSTCHTPHQPTAFGYQLRMPERALCIQCHTSEGTQPPDSPHQPQQEMLTGTGLDGLSGAPMMGGAATCSVCHMVEVGFGPSHTWFPVKPEDTIKEGKPNSCTWNCHHEGAEGGGFVLSDGEAQGMIEYWQGDTEGYVAETEEVRTAAGQALTDVKTNFIGLYDSDVIKEVEFKLSVALFTVTMVEEDESMGIHNFHYAKNLLKFGKKESEEALVMMDIPILSDISVTPATGTSNDTFVYNVTYFDRNNDPALKYVIVLDGEKYLMTPVDENATDFRGGQVFTYEQVNATDEYHDFYFIFSDGTTEIETDPMTGAVIVPPPPELPKDMTNQAPTVAIMGPVGGKVAGDIVNFSLDMDLTYDPDGEVVAVFWNFGDGFAGMGETTMHVFEAMGNYTVTVVVLDDKGASNSTSINISIGEGPPDTIYATRGDLSKALETISRKVDYDELDTKADRDEIAELQRTVDDDLESASLLPILAIILAILIGIGVYLASASGISKLEQRLGDSEHDEHEDEHEDEDDDDLDLVHEDDEEQAGEEHEEEEEPKEKFKDMDVEDLI